jgi:glyoxylase-like metal-dependent hydrolase (beta-lactamase superfamily II)
LAATRPAANVSVITGAGANVVVLESATSLALVDGGSAEQAEALMSFLASEFGGRKIEILFNTHWHVRQTGLNETAGKAGAKIIAHENTKLWLGTEVNSKWEHKVYPPHPVSARPTQTFYTIGKVAFGDATIQYGALPQAHTDGDLYVFFPQANVLAAGDVVSVGKYPILDYSTGGWIGGMVQATKTLLGIANPDTRIVPAEGPVQSRQDLEALNQMLSTAMDRMVKLLKQGMSANDMLAAAPTKDFDAKWGNPELFIRNAYPGLWGHVRELGGIV